MGMMFSIVHTTMSATVSVTFVFHQRWQQVMDQKIGTADTDVVLGIQGRQDTLRFTARAILLGRSSCVVYLSCTDKKVCRFSDIYSTYHVSPKCIE